MANDLNQCNFIGRLGKDPEVRYTANSDPVASFSLAVGWKSKNDEGCEWVNVVTFGKVAEIVGEYLKKGKQVFVSGRMHTRKWQDKEGKDRYTTEIVADRVQMLGSKADGEQAERPERPAAKPAARPAAKPTKAQTGFEDMEDDIPF